MKSRAPLVDESPLAVYDWRGSARDYLDIAANGVTLRQPDGSTRQTLIADGESFDRVVLTMAMANRRSLEHFATTDRAAVDAFAAGWAAIKASWAVALTTAVQRRRLVDALADRGYFATGEVTTRDPDPPPPRLADVHLSITAPRPGPRAGTAPAAALL